MKIVLLLLMFFFFGFALADETTNSQTILELRYNANADYFWMVGQTA